MVKFSKELQAQLIPEWKEAFVNYSQLKKHIKKIKQSRQPKQSQHPFRFIANKLLHSNAKVDIIKVKCRRTEKENPGEVYQTELLHLFTQEDHVKAFFEELDDDLNKVNRFFVSKESEFLQRGEALYKQLEILRELKRVLNDRRRRSSPPCDSPFSVSDSDGSVITRGSTIAGHVSLGSSETGELAGFNFVKPKKGKLSIASTAVGTIASTLWEEFLNSPKKEADALSRKKVQCAEKMIRSALVELYRGLGLLKTYSSLNLIAFVKILKKFDKVAGQQASDTYLKSVKRSQFVNSDKVVRLMDNIELTFTTSFANNDRKKAMQFLRPRQRKGSHMLTFFVGLFTGCFVTLFGTYTILAHMTVPYRDATYAKYVEQLHPLFSAFALLSLHLFLYGCNLFAWKKVRINYNFIFEFHSSTALKCRDAFLLCTVIMATLVGAMVLHLLLRAHAFLPTHADVIPHIVLMIFTAALICPFNIIYKPTRYCFLRVVRNIVLSPFYKVVMVDFFMADQLTSQIPLLRYMESSACYFLVGGSEEKYNSCKSGRVFIEFAYVLSFLPYYFRAMQCVRRWHDEGDGTHLTNMGKYLSAMVAACLRLTYARNKENNVLLALVLVSSLIATMYQLYWDFVKDWGFFDMKSRNWLLRDDLILKRKWIYFVSIGLNVVLRVAWVESVIRFRVSSSGTTMLDFLCACLEVIRRGHWNFYRLENEHLNNCGKFRAVKAVSLPFSDDSD